MAASVVRATICARVTSRRWDCRARTLASIRAVRRTVADNARCASSASVTDRRWSTDRVSVGSLDVVAAEATSRLGLELPPRHAKWPHAQLISELERQRTDADFSPQARRLEPVSAATRHRAESRAHFYLCIKPAVSGVICGSHSGCRVSRRLASTRHPRCAAMRAPKMLETEGRNRDAVQMPAAGGGNSGALSGSGACARQMVHRRHSLPCADRRRPRRWSPAMPPRRGIRARSTPTSARAQVNREQAERTRIQFTSVEKRLADMDRMGIDIQAISPSPNQTYYGADPDLGIATARVVNDNLADIAGRHPDRFVPLGTVPFQAPDLAVAELDRIHKSLGFRGIEIATNVAGEDFSAERFRKIFARDRGTRPPHLHAPDRVSRGAALRRPLPRQRDRQPARFDGRRPSPDLWRRACTTTPT